MLSARLDGNGAQRKQRAKQSTLQPRPFQALHHRGHRGHGGKSRTYCTGFSLCVLGVLCGGESSRVDCERRSTYHEYRNITCVVRMNPPCDTMVPNAELPWVVFIWLPRSCTRLNRLMTSIFNWNCLPPLRPTFFATDKSVSV